MFGKGNLGNEKMGGQSNGNSQQQTAQYRREIGGVESDAIGFDNQREKNCFDQPMIQSENQNLENDNSRTSTFKTIMETTPVQGNDASKFNVPEPESQHPATGSFENVPIVEVPPVNTSLEQADFNRHHSSFSEIDSQTSSTWQDPVISYTWRDVGASPQEKFEEDLESITQGTNLFHIDIDEHGETTSTRIKRALDGREMLAALAEGKVTYPLTISKPELSGAIAFALSDNIEKIDQKIAELRMPIAERGQILNDLHDSSNSIELLELYKDALSEGIKILLSIQQDESKDDQFHQKTITTLHEIFALFDRSLAAKAEGWSFWSFNTPQYLTNQGQALLKRTNEEEKPNPREKIIKGYQKSFDLFKRAFAARESGNHLKSRYLANQGVVILKLTDEKARTNPRDNIIKGYEDSYRLFKWALEDLDLDNPNNHVKSVYLSDQSKALLELTNEKARTNPRNNIIKGYEESYRLFRRAVFANGAGQGRKGMYLGDQGNALMELTKEKAKPHPRENIIRGYRESFLLLARALGALADGVGSHSCLAKQGRTILVLTDEEARPNPRPDIIIGYQESLELFQKSLVAAGQNRGEEADELKRQGIKLLRTTENTF